MSWTIDRVTDTTPEAAYEILKKHRLLLASVEASVAACKGLAASQYRYVVKDENDEKVADIFIGGIIEGDSASIDFIPVPKNFRAGFDDNLIDAVSIAISEVIEEHGLRRLTAIFPASRSRTKRALCALGFAPEGRIRNGAVMYDGKTEDLRVLGLLSRDLVCPDPSALFEAAEGE